MDVPFMKDRAQVCREWNTLADRSRTDCRKKHVCNLQDGLGKCYKGEHKASAHP